jgi:endonuclease/exonuclease/phosphatase (EEP) superfamily protein YafD
VNTTDRLIRWAAALSVSTVTAIAAIISYRHAYELVHRYGETGTTARVLPLTIDGLIATCSLVLLDCARHCRRPLWHAWALLAAGVVATLGANIAHGADHGIIGALVAGWPALVAVGSFELATRLLKGQQQAPAANRATLLSSAGDNRAGPDMTPNTNQQDTQDPVVAAAQKYFAEVLAAGDVPSLRALKRELHVGHARAVRIRAALKVAD